MVGITRPDATTATQRLYPCSTPEGVMVGITRMHLGDPSRSSQCSTPEGVMVGITIVGEKDRAAERLVLNARGRHGRDHQEAIAAGELWAKVLNARGRHGRDHGRVPRDDRDGVRPVLNARGRHGRDHLIDGWFPSAVLVVCSTPEGVMVGITAQRGNSL